MNINSLVTFMVCITMIMLIGLQIYIAIKDDNKHSVTGWLTALVWVIIHLINS